jgi:hypothetical protein
MGELLRASVFQAKILTSLQKETTPAGFTLVRRVFALVRRVFALVKPNGWT